MQQHRLSQWLPAKILPRKTFQLSSRIHVGQNSRFGVVRALEKLRGTFRSRLRCVESHVAGMYGYHFAVLGLYQQPTVSRNTDCFSTGVVATARCGYDTPERVESGRPRLDERLAREERVVVAIHGLEQ